MPSKIIRLITSLFIFILPALIQCSGGNSSNEDENSVEKFQGIWFNRDYIPEQGLFSAEIEIIGYEDVEGTISLHNNTIGTVHVKGKYSEEISSSNYSRYYSINLVNDSGNLKVSANDNNGYGFAGVIDYSDVSGDKRYILYTSEEEAVSISDAVKTSLSQISSIAVTADGSIWAFGKENSEVDESSIYKLNSDGQIIQGPYAFSFVSGIFDRGGGFLWFIKQTITEDEYGFEDIKYNFYRVSEDTFSIEFETELSCFIMGDQPFALSFYENKIYALYGFVAASIIELDADGNTVEIHAGTDAYDAFGLSVAGNKACILSAGRSFDSFIYVSNLDGTEARSYLAPGDTVSDLRIVGGTVYLSTSDGWILKMPESELEK